jgi:hypothetical protein
MSERERGERERLAEIKRRLSTSPPDPIRDNIDRWLIGKVERQRDLLKRLEWAGRYPEQGGLVLRAICPVCYAYYGDDHEPDCWLAAEIGTT